MHYYHSFIQSASETLDQMLLILLRHVNASHRHINLFMN